MDGGSGMSRKTLSNDRLLAMAEFWQGSDRNATPPMDLHSALDELMEWRECALYDATMEGPAFKGWDRSRMDRLRKEAEQAK